MEFEKGSQEGRFLKKNRAGGFFEPLKRGRGKKASREAVGDITSTPGIHEKRAGKGELRKPEKKISFGVRCLRFRQTIRGEELQRPRIRKIDRGQ